MKPGMLRNTGAQSAPALRPTSWLWLALLAFPALVAALVPEPSHTPPRKDFFDIGVLPQDRDWLCWADGVAGCSAQDFVRGYGLDRREARPVAELIDERIRGGGKFDPKATVPLRERSNCGQTKDQPCRGQVSGL